MFILDVYYVAFSDHFHPSFASVTLDAVSCLQEDEVLMLLLLLWSNQKPSSRFCSINCNFNSGSVVSCFIFEEVCVCCCVSKCYKCCFFTFKKKKSYIIMLFHMIFLFLVFLFKNQTGLFYVQLFYVFVNSKLCLIFIVRENRFP